MRTRTAGRLTAKPPTAKPHPAIAWAEKHEAELDAGSDAFLARPDHEGLVLIMRELPDGSPAFDVRERAHLRREALRHGDRTWTARFGRTPLPGTVEIFICPRNGRGVLTGRVRLAPNAPGGAS